MGSSGAEPVASVARVAVASVALPRGARYQAIVAVDGKVVLSGGSAGSLVTSASDAMGAVRCDSVVVNPATLALSEERSGPCDDPRLYGVHALVVNSFINGNPEGAPPIDRPLIAADADGFWLAPAGNSSGHGLYHVAPGMKRPAVVSTVGYGAMWMVASGHSVWLDLNHYPRHATLLRFDGTKLALRVPAGPSLSGGELGYGQPKYVGGANGIWTVRQQAIVHIDAETAHASKFVRIPGADGQPTPVMLDGSLFVLESPRTLYRVTL